MNNFPYVLTANERIDSFIVSQHRYYEYMLHNGETYLLDYIGLLISYLYLHIQYSKYFLLPFSGCVSFKSIEEHLFKSSFIRRKAGYDHREYFLCDP